MGRDVSIIQLSVVNLVSMQSKHLNSGNFLTLGARSLTFDCTVAYLIGARGESMHMHAIVCRIQFRRW